MLLELEPTRFARTEPDGGATPLSIEAPSPDAPLALAEEEDIDDFDDDDFDDEFDDDFEDDFDDEFEDEDIEDGEDLQDEDDEDLDAEDEFAEEEDVEA